MASGGLGWGTRSSSGPVIRRLHLRAARLLHLLKPRWRNPLQKSTQSLDHIWNDHQLHSSNCKGATLPTIQDTNKSVITMAEQLLEQARDLFEGQIVRVSFTRGVSLCSC